MFKIYFDNSQFVVLVDGKQISCGVIELQLGKSYILTLLPIFDKTLFLPISSTAECDNGNLVCNIPHIKIDQNQFYLIPKFAPHIPPSTPKVELQREFGEHTITVWTDGVPKLNIENSSNFIMVLLPEYPTKFQEAVLDSGVLFYCLCPHYLCVVFFDYNDYTLLVDKECDSYEFDESGITYEVNLKDNQGRKYTSHISFDGKEYVCDWDKFEYKCRHTPHERLIGYDFLQSLAVGDLDYCKLMMSPSCTQEIEHIATMFEDMQDIIIPACPTKKGCHYIAFSDKIRCCQISLQNGLITSISFKD